MTPEEFRKFYPEITEEEKKWLHYNPNTSDLVAWIQEYAMRTIAIVAGQALTRTKQRPDAVAQPKLVLALPDYETRKIVIVSDEIIEDERIVCVAIQPAHTSQPKQDAAIAESKEEKDNEG